VVARAARGRGDPRALRGPDRCDEARTSPATSGGRAIRTAADRPTLRASP
jgi:hypothetical protein